MVGSAREENQQTDTKAAFKEFAHLLKVVVQRKTKGAWEAGVIQHKRLFVSQSTKNDIKHGRHVEGSLCKGQAVPSQVVFAWTTLYTYTDIGGAVT